MKLDTANTFRMLLATSLLHSLLDVSSFLFPHVLVSTKVDFHINDIIHITLNPHEPSKISKVLSRTFKFLVKVILAWSNDIAWNLGETHLLFSKTYIFI